MASSKVLVIEDNRINLELVAAVLDAAGRDGCVTKPIDTRAFSRQVSEFIREEVREG